jgi:hypothetical protein
MPVCRASSVAVDMASDKQDDIGKFCIEGLKYQMGQ